MDHTTCPLAFNPAIPSVVDPSRKITLPVGMPTAGVLLLTVAVMLSAVPTTDGLAGDIAEVRVEILFGDSVVEEVEEDVVEVVDEVVVVGITVVVGG